MHHKWYTVKFPRDKWNMSIFFPSGSCFFFFFPPWLAFGSFHSPILLFCVPRGDESWVLSKLRVVLCGKATAERALSLCRFSTLDWEAEVGNMISGEWKHCDLKAHVSHQVWNVTDDSQDTGDTLSPRTSWAYEMLHNLVSLSCRQRLCSPL